jgi:hypothetical protein
MVIGAFVVGGVGRLLSSCPAGQANRAPRRRERSEWLQADRSTRGGHRPLKVLTGRKRQAGRSGESGGTNRSRDARSGTGTQIA